MGGWRNVPGTVKVEDIRLRDVWEDDDGEPLPELVQEALKARYSDADDDTELDMDIEFSSSGYYNAGRRGGLPEYCYPPEGEDNRTLDRITVSDGIRKLVLEGEAAKAAFAHFFNRVESTEIDTDRD